MKKLTYKEKVDWFVANHYETGMEYSSIYEYLKDKDLSNIDWYGSRVSIPDEL